MPRQTRQVLFGRGELTRAILEEPRDPPRPLGIREIAQAIVALNGQDARDRRLISGFQKRPNALKLGKILRSVVDERGNKVWSVPE
jgi:hypothetical protein